MGQLKNNTSGGGYRVRFDYHNQLSTITHRTVGNNVTNHLPFRDKMCSCSLAFVREYALRGMPLSLASRRKAGEAFLFITHLLVVPCTIDHIWVCGTVSCLAQCSIPTRSIECECETIGVRTKHLMLNIV